MKPGVAVRIIAGVMAVAASGICLLLAQRGSVIDVGAEWWQLAIAFFLAEWAVAHIEIRKQAHTLSLSEAVLLVGLLLLSPVALLVARVSGAGMAMLIRRQSLEKLAFNSSLFAFEAAVASVLFHSAFGVTSRGPLAWAAGGIAVLASILLGAVIVAGVISLFDRHRPPRLLLAVLAAQAATATVTISLTVVGAAAIAESWTNTAYLMALFGGAVWMLRRQAATAQRASNLESLSRFTAHLVGLASTSQVMDTALDQAAATMRASYAAVVVTGESSARGTFGLDSGAISEDLLASLVAAVGETETASLISDCSDTSGQRAEGVAAPLQVAGSPAVMAAWHRSTDVGEFTNDGLGLFQSLVNQTQVALDRATLIDQLAHDAHHDGLTKLPNRLGFADRAAELAGSGALLIMDLDRFKDINDTLGHPTGDRALELIAARLAEIPGEFGVLGRLGGDEFALFDPGSTDDDQARILAERVIQAVEEPIVLDDLSLRLGVSIGIALAPFHGDDLITLMSHADSAMYEAKRRQMGWQIYSRERDSNNPRRLELVSSLRQAIGAGELDVYYQPKIRTADRVVVGAEALARWEHPRYGFVPPDEFVALAEGAGLMRELTDAVLERVIVDSVRWDQLGMPLQVAVNLSTRNLLDDELPDRIDQMIRRGNIQRSRIAFEITETSIMLDRDRVQALLHRLHDELGFAIAIDDYGTGYSSLAYLRDLPVDQLKIDRAFVTNLDLDRATETIVRSTIDLGHNLGLSVVAEGIEREAELQLLQALGCDYAQGYLVSRPLPVDRFQDWFRHYNPLLVGPGTNGVRQHHQVKPPGPPTSRVQSPSPAIASS